MSAKSARKWERENPKRYQESMRRRNLRKRYGITLEEYNDMLYNQDEKCAICGVVECRVNTHFSVDHNHETGEVRGLLCNDCNTGLGLFLDDPERLKRAIHYLTKGA